MKPNETDDLDLQLGIVIDILQSLSVLLSDRGYLGKSNEAKGAAEIAREWRREYRAEGRQESC